MFLLDLPGADIPPGVYEISLPSIRLETEENLSTTISNIFFTL